MYAYFKFDYVEGIIYFLVAFKEVRVLPAHQRKTLLIWTIFLSTYLERNIVANARATIVLLTLNIIVNRLLQTKKKHISIIKLILIRWEDNLYYLTGQKISWYKIKASQLRNYGSLLNLKFMKSKISSFQKNWMEFHHGKLRVACQLIKSFVMLYGIKVS